MPSLKAILEKIQARVPDPVLRYGAALLSITLLTAVIDVLLHTIGRNHPLVFGLLGILFFIVILWSAWLGYGPGLMVCALTVFVLPHVLPSANRGTQQSDYVRFGLVAIISLLVSRIGESGRRREAELRHAAEDLERRVADRTADAVRSAEETRAAMESLREQAQLLDLAHDAILALDCQSLISFWNAGAEELYGWTREEAVGKLSHQLLQTEFPEEFAQIEQKLAKHGRWEGELVHTRQDGGKVRVSSRWALRRGPDGKPAGFLEINRDITEKRKIEEQLRHTQKLESLGVLAGGVAHDFNNLLTGVLGNASLALDATTPHHPNRSLLEEVMKAAERAADLTRQLLAYAGKGRFVMRTVHLSDLVREISGLVQTSIPKPVQLRMQLADTLPGIDADPGQLQQIVMNLVINGAEAIDAAGGTVLVHTGVQEVDEQYISTLSSAGEMLQPGTYVCLEVHDTGAGMNEQTLAKIFDPFFTTKFAGRGLGLSAVLGIVRSHKGALKVYSRPGQGTTFKVLFPASANAPTTPHVTPVGDLVGSGTVLVADDEEIVRRTAKYTLERYGYAAVTVPDGAEAVAAYRRDPTAISLVLLDLTMPVMSGEEALRQMQTINPQVRVLLSSGYNEVEAVQRFAGKGLAGFIQKPYTSAALAEKIKEVLNGR